MTKMKIQAFSLAEVLITLGIIGVIAAITLPTLLNNIQENQYKIAYKKAYSAIVQAFLKASQEGDIVPLLYGWSSSGSEANFDAIKKQFIVSKDCDAAHSADCWNASGEIWRYENLATKSFIDNSGMAWKLRANDSNGVVPAIFVDTNGSKKPNQYGKDRFPFLYSNKSDVGYWNNAVSDMGIPTKIIVQDDVINFSYSGAESFCPSLAIHPCYFTSWIIGNH